MGNLEESVSLIHDIDCLSVGFSVYSSKGDGMIFDATHDLKTSLVCLRLEEFVQALLARSRV